MNPDEHQEQYERLKRDGLLLSIEQVSEQLAEQVAALQEFVGQLRAPPLPQSSLSSQDQV